MRARRTRRSLIPLVFLTVLTFLIGFVAFDQVGDALGFPGGINSYVYFPEPHDFHFSDSIAAVTGTVSLLGFLTAWWFFWGRNSHRAQAVREFQPRLAAVIENKFYFDEAYQWGIDRAMLPLARIVAWFDRMIVNDTGINAPADATRYAAYWLRYHVTGRIPDYALLMVVGVALAGGLAFLLRG